MGHLSRRSLIKGAGTLSVLNFIRQRPIARSLLEHTGLADEKEKRLNVVLHGLFVVNFTQCDIELLTPMIEEHEYHAGSWDRSAIYPLCEGREYKLRGVACSANCVTQPPYYSNGYDSQDPHNLDCNVVLSQSRDLFTVQRQNSYFVVHLPFPADIYLKRCLRPDNPSNLFSGQDAYLIKSKGISLCPVLVYRVKDFNDVYLYDTQWQPKPCEDRDYQVANLHFWAEPPDRSNPSHTQNAYKKLMDLLQPLQFQLTANEMPAVDLVTDVPGLLPEEEQGWAEWQGGGGEGSRPTNCNPVMSC